MANSKRGSGSGQLPLVYHPQYSCPFPSTHRFPMEKFRLLHQFVVDQGIAGKHNIWRPGPCPDRILGLAHDLDYVHRFKHNELSRQELRELGLPWSPGLVKRTLISPAGTLLAAQLALQHGLACHLAGGTHHAHYDRASGFCVINDLAVTAAALVRQPGVRTVLIFDCDVHQGDGTAAILSQQEHAKTCSIHCEKNYPMRKQKSDWDIGLNPGLNDAEYLDCVRETFLACLSRWQPDLVLYDAGVDVWQDDPLGLLNISLEGIAQRDQFVIETCVNKNIPIATVIGGGYDKDRFRLAARHGIVVQQAHNIYQTLLA